MLWLTVSYPPLPSSLRAVSIVASRSKALEIYCSGAALQRLNRFTHVQIRNTNRHDQHGKILILEPSSQVLMIRLATVLAKTRPPLQHVGV